MILVVVSTTIPDEITRLLYNINKCQELQLAPAKMLNIDKELFMINAQCTILTFNLTPGDSSRAWCWRAECNSCNA